MDKKELGKNTCCYKEKDKFTQNELAKTFWITTMNLSNAVINARGTKQ